METKCTICERPTIRDATKLCDPCWEMARNFDRLMRTMPEGFRVWLAAQGFSNGITRQLAGRIANLMTAADSVTELADRIRAEIKAKSLAITFPPGMKGEAIGALLDRIAALAGVVAVLQTELGNGLLDAIVEIAGIPPEASADVLCPACLQRITDEELKGPDAMTYKLGPEFEDMRIHTLCLPGFEICLRADLEAEDFETVARLYIRGILSLRPGALLPKSYMLSIDRFKRKASSHGIEKERAPKRITQMRVDSVAFGGGISGRAVIEKDHDPNDPVTLGALQSVVDASGLMVRSVRADAADAFSALIEALGAPNWSDERQRLADAVKKLRGDQ